MKLVRLLQSSRKNSKFSQNDPFGKIDRVKLLLNQLISIPEDQFEDKSKDVEFYIKEFQLREEEFLLSVTATHFDH
jgi:hypothetical protein